MNNDNNDNDRRPKKFNKFRPGPDNLEANLTVAELLKMSLGDVIRIFMGANQEGNSF